jgi:hypothetical protein
MIRTGVLIVSFLPFVYYAIKDGIFHFKGRKVSLTEHLLHTVILITLGMVFSHAIMGNHTIMLVALVLFLVGGSIDEYIFHHHLPEEESDLHAKGHLALLIFIVICMNIDWHYAHPGSLLNLIHRIQHFQS